MKIGFVFTNYNNSKFTRQAVESLSLSDHWQDCFVVVVDNNSNDGDLEILKQVREDYPSIHLILNKENFGYFRGLNCGIKYLRENFLLEYVVVGNNDLVFPSDFTNSLHVNLSTFSKHAVIAPDLVTLDGVHQNPHVIKGISKFREKVYDLYYSNYYLSVIIGKVAMFTKVFSDRTDEREFEKPQIIAQGYGACYILGPIFFQYFSELWSPTFLMHEEYFLSKQLQDKCLAVFYEPSIKVNHHDHATVGKLPSKSFWNISKEAHKVYRRYNPL